jgi:hypothetical protein
MLKFIAEWFSMVSAALIVAAIIGQGAPWIAMLGAIVFFGFALYLFYKGGKNAD